jgi:hypothetical protein
MQMPPDMSAAMGQGGPPAGGPDPAAMGAPPAPPMAMPMPVLKKGGRKKRKARGKTTTRVRAKRKAK